MKTIHKFQFAKKTKSKRYEIDIDTGCWVWLLKLSRGYPYNTLMNGRAHRWLYKQYINPNLSRAIHLHHKCENKLCVNPWHMQEKDPGQHNKLHKTGKINPRRMLTTSQASEVIELHSKGVSLSELRTKYQVPRGVIYRILKGQTICEGEENDH